MRESAVKEKNPTIISLTHNMLHSSLLYILKHTHGIIGREEVGGLKGLIKTFYLFERRP
jgi:hypothetical protein